MTTIEPLLDRLGRPGRFQLLISALLATNILPVVINDVLINYLFLVMPNFSCKLEETVSNASSKEPLLLSSCRSNTSSECEHIFHFEQAQQWNLVSEFDLVCERLWLISLLQLANLLALMLGGLLMSHLADTFGRRTPMLTCLYSQCALGLAIYFVDNIQVYMIARVVQALLLQGLLYATLSMITELFSAHFRIYGFTLCTLMFPSGKLIAVLVNSQVLHWRLVQLALHLPSLATIFFACIVPESLPFLVSSEDTKRAEAVVIRLVCYNDLRQERSRLKQTLSLIHNNSEKYHNNENFFNKDKTNTIYKAEKGSRLKNALAVAYFIGFTVGLGLRVTNLPSLGLATHPHMLILCLVEAAALLLLCFVLNTFVLRRMLILLYLLLLALATAIIAAMHTGLIEVRWIYLGVIVDESSLLFLSLLISRLALLSILCLGTLITSELAPTSCRTRALGMLGVVVGIGALLQTQLRHLNFMVRVEVSEECFEFVVLLVLASISAVLTALLIETANRPMRDKFNDDFNEYVKKTFVRGIERKGSNCGSTTAYEKSPEWTEVNGMIVSKGFLASHDRRQATLSRLTWGPDVGDASVVSGHVCGSSDGSHANLILCTSKETRL